MSTLTLETANLTLSSSGDLSLPPGQALSEGLGGS